MEDFTYKEYSEDESRVLMKPWTNHGGMRSGLTFYESCSAVIVEDEQLKELIIDDALKIMIADIHYRAFPATCCRYPADFYGQNTQGKFRNG
jgi:hypothetical protein